MYLVFVSSECPYIIFHPLQRCELIPQTEVKDFSFSDWRHCRQQYSTTIRFSPTLFALREPERPKAIIEANINDRSSLKNISHLTSRLNEEEMKTYTSHTMGDDGTSIGECRRSQKECTPVSDDGS